MGKKPFRLPLVEVDSATLIDGGWGSWSSWSPCSTSCGTGHRSRTGVCDNPIPQHGGHGCHGNNIDTESCAFNQCPSVHFCDKFGTIQALAELNVTSKVHCDDRWSSETDNFLHTHCHGIPADVYGWHQGGSVMSDCLSHSIGLFTPIGTFRHGTYNQVKQDHGGVSGIFLGCTSTGFKMATKACDGGAEIIDIPHYTNATFASDAIISNNPRSYFTIEW
ncbi:uncharacterized protein LOC117318060 [Pecten maximus]|uniref:uncharacterized protein LOC117318060 n=1 Tax=Pecten maximus TaxID=6579 RepID=UPI001457EE2A|nr:uncharacterized protein LOC117318060 [Pecten maximus]